MKKKLKTITTTLVLLYSSNILANQYEIDIFLDLNQEIQSNKMFMGQAFSFDKIKCGYQHCYGLKNGNWYSGGYNRQGQLGLGKTDKKIHGWTKIPINNIKQIEPYANFGLIITKNNKVYSVGNSKSGKIGQPKKKYYTEWTKVSLPKSIGALKLLMSERVTYLFDKDNNQYYGSGKSVDGKGRFSFYNQKYQMEFVKVDLETVIIK